MLVFVRASQTNRLANPGSSIRRLTHRELRQDARREGPQVNSSCRPPLLANSSAFFSNLSRYSIRLASPRFASLDALFLGSALSILPEAFQHAFVRGFFLLRTPGSATNMSSSPCFPYFLNDFCISKRYPHPRMKNHTSSKRMKR